MPAISFPPTPSDGDEYTANGRTWVFDASIPAWSPKLLPYEVIISPHKSTHATGGTDPLTPGDIGAEVAGAASAAQANAAGYTDSVAATTLEAAEDYADAAIASALGGSTKFDAGSISGTVQLDFADGNVQTCVLSGNITFDSPLGGEEGDTMSIFISDTTGVYTLNFNLISMDAAAALLLPISLEDASSYRIQLMFLGGQWCLVDILGPFPGLPDILPP